MEARPRILRFLVLAWCWLVISSPAAETLRLATYNVENYLDRPSGTRKPKPEEAKAQVRSAILALNADVIAFQEMGQPSALLELRASLKAAGLDYPHWEHVTGFDTNIFVGVLSKHPFTARRSHTNANYLLNGRRLHLSRGIAELDVKVGGRYAFTFLAAHLKSKLPVGVANEADMREEEAKVLRAIIDARLKANPEANLVVVGDLNDTRDSKPIRTLVGRGKTKLVDTRPAERHGETLGADRPGYGARNVVWTHFYGAEDTYSRIDYIFLSPGMAREWRAEESYVLAQPNWGLASDHRPIVVTVTAVDQ